MRWFQLAMPGVYIVAGLLLLLTDTALDFIPQLRTGIGLLLIGYGGYRAWRAWNEKKEQE